MPSRPASPRRLTLTSDDRRYASVMRLVAQRRATVRGVRYLPGGRKAVVVALHQKRNDHMTLDPEYFQTALKDYDRWPIKWWREAIQNAVDAGATVVECGVERFNDRVKVYCRDNGKGMDRETLLTKFLRLGASGKRTDEGASGGFGKAKEMLLLPWLRWRVYSRDSRVEGVGINYTVQDQRMTQGTTLEVEMPPDNATSIEIAEEFIRRCYLPTVKFKLHAQDFTRGDEPSTRTITANAKVGKAIRELSRATIHHNPKGMHGFRVRTNGLWMFDRYLSSQVKGEVILELHGRSIDLLTANRDGFREYSLVRQVDEYLNELAADTSSALKEKTGQRKLYLGQGTFAARPPAAIEADLLAAGQRVFETIATTGGSATSIPPSALEQLLDALGASGQAQVSEGQVALGAMPQGAAQVVLRDLAVIGPEHFERTLRQMAWQPDFLLVNERPAWKPPRGLLPEKMNRAALRLAKVWTELCRWVLIYLNSPEQFGVGWIFEGGTGAAYSQERGRHFLLLNPLRADETLFDPAKPEELSWLVACAVHEATHVADGIAFHNEVFATAVTRNFAKCSRIWELAPGLARAVLGGAEINLERALHVEEKPAKGGKGPRHVEVPAPVQSPLDWYARPIGASHAPKALELTHQRPVSRGHQLGLFARKANRR